MNTTDGQQRAILRRIARRVMVERGLLPDFTPEATAEVIGIKGTVTSGDGQVRDLRQLLWASIDNDDSRDLDQLTVAEAMAQDNVKILVALSVTRNQHWSRLTVWPSGIRIEAMQVPGICTQYRAWHPNISQENAK